MKRLAIIISSLLVLALVSCGGEGSGKSAVKGSGPKLGEEMIKDGNFPDGSVKNYSVYNGLTDAIKAEVSGKWTFHVTMPANGTAEVKDGVFTVKVTAPGNDNWQLQLVQFPVPMKFGKKYFFQFDAKAEQPRAIAVKVGRIGGDWLAYSGMMRFDLTTEWQTFTKEFKAVGGDDFARLEFLLSGHPAGVSIRNVSIKPILE
ncbi:MAG: carbohydrate binding domain-containing protein [Brevinematales bacterium]